jgi:hypothetical protein
VEAKAFFCLSRCRPATNKSDLSALFTVRELGQPEDPKTGTPIAATSTQSSVGLWANDSHALVFVTAAPPTNATHSAVGVLFLLRHSNHAWRIADLQRSIATGNEADVSATVPDVTPPLPGAVGGAPA